MGKMWTNYHDLGKYTQLILLQNRFKTKADEYSSIMALPEFGYWYLTLQPWNSTSKKQQGPVVQSISIVSLTTWLTGQLVKRFMIL